MNPLRHPNWRGLERPDSNGQLDWVSGTIRLNCSLEELQNVLNKQASKHDERSREIAETLQHEFYHLIQIASTGYMYWFCLRLWQLMGPSLKMQSANVHEMNPPLKELNEVRQHIAKLNQPGQYGLTPKDVIEAAAFHYQISSSWVGAVRHFPDALYPQNPIYQSAYKLAEEYLGDKAFYFIPILANHSLCWAHPGNAFNEFVRQVALYVKRGDGIPWKIFNKTSEKYLGSALEVAQLNGEHPLYIDRVINLIRMVDRKNLFESPHQAIDVDLASEMLPPIILNFANGKRPVWTRPQADKELVQALVVLAQRAGEYFSLLYQ